MADGVVEITLYPSLSHAHAGTHRGTRFRAGMMREFLREAGGCAVIDGGLATELEAHGADLKDPLWSAKYLFTSPDLIKKACPPSLFSLILGTLPISPYYGLHLRGSDRCSKDGISSKQHPVLIAASIGSYGAYLADGSDGNYGLQVTLETLKDFHRRRLKVLSEAGADIIAFETIPSKIEAQVLFDAYISVSGFSLSCSLAATYK
ncbi:hypothetical protein GW17_00006644 [Ensete ventricosum]|nr:hypothetical protein GW17_00006644 [Ensete ventricosum]